MRAELSRVRARLVVSLPRDGDLVMMSAPCYRLVGPGAETSPKGLRGKVIVGDVLHR